MVRIKTLGCVFELGEGGRDEGESWVSGEVGWKRGGGGVNVLARKLVIGATVPPFKTGRKKILLQVWGLYMVSPWVNWGLTLKVL
nr:hypothetical protein [Tanacetum cinerariifolium]